MKKVLWSMMIALVILPALLTATPRPAHADSLEPPETEWSQTYGGTADDRVTCVIQTEDGGYALAGCTYSFGAGKGDFWLVKTDSNGNMQWHQAYGGTEYDVAISLLQSRDGGYALAGHTESFGSGGRDFWLVKTDAHGNMQWSQTYGKPNTDEVVGAVVHSIDGEYVIAGWTGALNGPSDFWLVKTDSSGNMQWSRTYHNDYIDRAEALTETIEGGYAMAGVSGPSGTGRDIWFVKIDLNGNVQWSQTYGGDGNDYAHDIIQTSDGGYALTGPTYSFGAGSADFWLLKTDSIGSLLWHQAYGGGSYEGSYSLVETTDGEYVIAGHTGSFGAGDIDFWLVKTDGSGNMQWGQTYGGTYSESAQSLIRTTDGGYAMAGHTQSFGAGGADCWLIKIAAERMPQIECPCIWLYNFDRYDPDSLVSNLNDTGFKTVFLSTSIAALRAHDESYVAKLRSFIGKAEEEGIFVHAMILQDPRFANRTEHYNALQDLGEVLDYNLENPDRAFDGIHIDVEPYGLKAWKEASWENRNAIMAMYIELLSEIHQELQGKSMLFSAAHPHWYQNRANEFPDKFPNGETSQFGQYLDAIVLMVYDGGSGRALDTTREILDEAEEEIEKADIAGNIQIVVGLGVHEFWKHSWLNDCMVQVDGELETSPSYKGLSIFNYKSFSEMRTWEYRIEDRTRHTVLMINTTDRLFKFDNSSTPEDEFSMKEAMLMLRIRGIIVIHHRDEEIILLGRIIDRPEIGFCWTTAEDLQTDKKYLLWDLFWLGSR